MTKKNGMSKKDHRLSSIESALKRKPYNRRLLTGQSRIIVPPSTLSDVLVSGNLNTNGALSPPTGSPVMMADMAGKYGGAALSSSSSSIDTQLQQQGADATAAVAVATVPGRIGIRPFPTTHQIQHIKQLIEHNRVIHSGELQPEVSFQPRGSTSDRGNHYPKFHFNCLPTPSPPSSDVAPPPPLTEKEEEEGRLCLDNQQHQSNGHVEQQQNVDGQLNIVTTSEVIDVDESQPTSAASVDLSFNVFAALLVAFEKVPAPEHYPFDGYF